MKSVKRILTLVLVLLMSMTLALPALAAEQGSITIDNAVNGKTYTIYRMLDLSDHNPDYSGVRYRVSEKWKAFFAEGAVGASYVNFDAQGYVTWNAEKDPADFAADAIAYAEENGIVSDGETTAANGKALFSNLELGYYLVRTGVGATCSLDTTTPDVVMKEKNSDSVSKKEVQEDSTQNWGESNDADIGQSVHFKTTIRVLDGAPKNYVLHDVMSDGLSFDAQSVQVTIGDRTLTYGTDYTLSTGTLNDGCTFELAFADGVLAPNDVVSVSYSAVLTQDAKITEANTNKSRITYGENKETTWDETQTRTWKLDVFKYAMQEDEEIPLLGARFVLYKMTGNEKNYVLADENGVVSGWTTDGIAPETPETGKRYATEFVTPASGSFTVKGLDSDTYYLEEIAAPAGYNLLSAPIEVTIDADGTVSYAGSTGTVRVLNQAGAELPSTGGVGTAAFTFFGGTMAAAAGILLVTKKRMHEKR